MRFKIRILYEPWISVQYMDWNKVAVRIYTPIIPRSLLFKILSKGCTKTTTSTMITPKTPFYKVESEWSRSAVWKGLCFLLRVLSQHWKWIQRSLAIRRGSTNAICLDLTFPLEHKDTRMRSTILSYLSSAQLTCWTLPGGDNCSWFLRFRCDSVPMSSHGKVVKASLCFHAKAQM